MNVLPVDLQPNVHICYIFWRSFMLFILIFFSFSFFIFLNIVKKHFDIYPYYRCQRNCNCNSFNFSVKF